MAKVKDVLKDMKSVQINQDHSRPMNHQQITKVLKNSHSRTEILNVEHYVDDDNQMHMNMKLSVIKKHLRIKIAILFILFLVLTICTFLVLDYTLNK